MNKRKFMNGLEEALLENMSPASARPHLEYYSDYIDSQVRQGKSEEEVVESLGNPRLIVKSLMDVNSENYGQNSSEFFEKEEQRLKNDKFDLHQFTGTMKAIISVLIALILVVVLFSLVARTVWVIFKIAVPLLLIAAVAVIVWRFIEKK